MPAGHPAEEASMKLHRFTLISLLSATALASGVATAASTTDYTDQWWVPTESGWGASVHQQAGTLVVDLMVYAADRKATWFVAAAAMQSSPSAGSTVFSGDLFQTTAPPSGAPSDLAAVITRKVGTLVFEAFDAHDARLTYSVDGSEVTKRVTRQTWMQENVSGTYLGGWNGDKTGCLADYLPKPVVHFDESLAITIDQAPNNTVTMNLLFAGGTALRAHGTYSQSGHLGKIVGEFDQSYPGWSGGAIEIIEFDRTGYGFTARFSGNLLWDRWGDWCVIQNGRIGGVRR